MRTAFLLLLLINQTAFSQYFESGINYFDEKPETIEKTEKKEIKKISKNKKSFEWKKYLNPESDEFFKEGNHIPPAPLMEAMRRPTPQNVKNYKSWLKKKNELMSRFNKELIRQGQNENQIKEIKNRVFVPKVSEKQLQDVKVLYFFSSTCPYCKKMNKEIDLLSSYGFNVKAYQVDKGKRAKISLKSPFQRVSQETLVNLNIRSVPYLKIINTKKNQSKNLLGFKTARQITREISKWK